MKQEPKTSQPYNTELLMKVSLKSKVIEGNSKVSLKSKGKSKVGLKSKVSLS